MRPKLIAILALLAGGLLLLLAALPVQVSRPPPSPPPARAVAAAALAPVQPAPLPVSPQRAPRVEAPPAKLDPESEAFAEHVDEVIPRKLYGAAARDCRWQGQPPEQKLKLGFKLRVIDGDLEIRELEVLKSSIADQGLEACLRDAVARQRWKEPRLPDFEEDEELVLRVDGMRKYASGEPEEQ